MSEGETEADAKQPPAGRAAGLGLRTGLDEQFQVQSQLQRQLLQAAVRTRRPWKGPHPPLPGKP